MKLSSQLKVTLLLFRLNHAEH